MDDAARPSEYEQEACNADDERRARGACTRRGFLHLSLAASVGALASGCGFGRAPAPTRRPSAAPPTSAVARSTAVPPAPDPTVDRSVALALDEGGGDAWVWRKRVSGRVVNPNRFTAVRLQAGDRRVDVQLEGDRFGAELPLAAGENTVSAIGRHRDGRQYASAPVVLNNRLQDRPTARIRSSLEGNVVTMDAASSERSPATNSPIAGYVYSARDGNPAPLRLPRIAGPRITVPAPSQDGEYYMTVRVTDEAGKEDRSTAYFVVEGGKPRLPKLETERPAWVERSVVYGVISRAFGPRGLADVTARLDALQELGVNALWLAPINESTEGFGYEVTDYFKLRQGDGGGTEEDFRELVRQAHARGIRVLMDFVPNHSSVQHPYFQDAEERREASTYFPYYARDESGQYQYYFEYDHLANLNYDNPEVRNWMLEAHAYWVREFDVDGFRVDIAWGPRERKPDYWPQWRAELKRIKPDLLLLAEAPGRDPYYYTEGYDAAYDWAAEYVPESAYDWHTDLGRWAWESIFDLEDEIPRRLQVALTNDGQGFPPDALLFRFLNNNDTGARFITTHGPEVTRVAATLLLTLPGIPCVYTGDEVGAEYEPYDEGCCIDWESDPNRLRPHYRRLIALRNELPALRSLEWAPVRATPADRVYGYVRYSAPGRDPVLVLLNWGAEAANARVRLPEDFGAVRGGAMRDALADERVPVRSEGRTLRVAIPAHSARVLVPE